MTTTSGTIATYQVQMLDPEVDEDGETVRWINAPSLESFLKFASRFRIADGADGSDVIPEEGKHFDVAEGVDVVLDDAGNVIEGDIRWVEKE